MTTNKRLSPGQEDICPSPLKRLHLGPSPSPQDWLASSVAISAALRTCAVSTRKVLLVPYRDVDGLCSSAIIFRTLQLLGKSLEDILVHFIGKGSSIHSDEARAILDAFDAEWVVVMDQGSRPGRAIVKIERGKKCLIIDHHWSEAFPEDSLVVSACKYEPVATSSLLTYEICKPLHPHVKRHTDWLAVTGTYGDLGSSTQFQSPFPVELEVTAKQYSKSTFATLVSLLTPERSTKDTRMQYLDSVVCTLSSKLVSLDVSNSVLNFNIANCSQIEERSGEHQRRSRTMHAHSPCILF
jgi:hypothetical protein